MFVRKNMFVAATTPGSSSNSPLLRPNSRVHWNLTIIKSVLPIHRSEFVHLLVVVATNSTCVLPICSSGHKQYMGGVYFQFIVVVTSRRGVLPICSSGHKQYTGGLYSQFIVMATNSKCVTHEVLAGVVSEGLVKKEV